MFYRMDHGYLMLVTTSTSFILFIEVEVLEKMQQLLNNWVAAGTFLGTTVSYSVMILDGTKQQGYGYINSFFWWWSSSLF